MSEVIQRGVRTLLSVVVLLVAVASFALCTASTVRAEAVSRHVPYLQAEGAGFISDRLSIEVNGTGPDVILIPGLASSREVWRPLAERLSRSHRVHLVQLSGFAGQPWSHGDGEFIAPAVKEVARYIESVGLDHPAVIGHSLGGLVGLLLGQQHPDQIGRLMTVDSLPFYSSLFGAQVTAESARPFADQAAAAILSADEEAFARQQARTIASLVRDATTRSALLQWSLASDRHAMAAAIKDVMTIDARPGLASMALPVTALYASDADGGAPATAADAIWSTAYATLPGVKLVRVDASRHFIMADQPSSFGLLIDEFLR